MSNNFHAGPNGPGICTASKQACPFGGESGSENHYGTLEEATAAFEAQNSDKNLASMSKGKKSFPVKVTDTEPINLKFSEKEIAQIVKDNPGAIILEPGKYIAMARGEGAKYSVADLYSHPEYEVFSYDPRPQDLSSDSTDEDLLAVAGSKDLEFDQLRFIRDNMKAEDDNTDPPCTVATSSGSSYHGYSSNLAFLDMDAVRKNYPGILNKDGRMKFNRGATAFELKNKAPIVNVDAPDEPNEDIAEMRATMDMERTNAKDIMPSVFTIGDPSKGKGSFVMSDITETA